MITCVGDLVGRGLVSRIPSSDFKFPASPFEGYLSPRCSVGPRSSRSAMLAHPQGRAPVRSARLLLSAARPGVRVSLFSRTKPASSDLGLGPSGFGKDPHRPRVSAEDSRGDAATIGGNAEMHRAQI
ncbi:hypothetical protein NDU88_008357 [Pleurodeles waltl]|uniref:Uncharacterized protein n=1 Tax=Pleurodeles waltl TaxID=8319 RepID=A0AAV7P0N8_PLEWA|nr:hypothetical protein NDU88_008357 [Pleurodeles waltl]